MKTIAQDRMWQLAMDIANAVVDGQDVGALEPEFCRAREEVKRENAVAQQEVRS